MNTETGSKHFANGQAKTDRRQTKATIEPDSEMIVSVKRKAQHRHKASKVIHRQNHAPTQGVVQRHIGGALMKPDDTARQAIQVTISDIGHHAFSRKEKLIADWEPRRQTTTSDTFRQRNTLACLRYTRLVRLPCVYAQNLLTGSGVYIEH